MAIFHCYVSSPEGIKSMFFQQATFEQTGGPGDLKQNIKSSYFLLVM